MSSEKAMFDAELRELEQFQKVRTCCRPHRFPWFLPDWQQPRFKRTVRPFPPSEVVNKRGTLPIQYPSDVMAKKLYKLLEAKARGEDGGCSFTYGA
jgi:isocitrate lyase